MPCDALEVIVAVEQGGAGVDAIGCNEHVHRLPNRYAPRPQVAEMGIGFNGRSASCGCRIPLFSTTGFSNLLLYAGVNGIGTH